MLAKLTLPSFDLKIYLHIHSNGNDFSSLLHAFFRTR